MSDHEGRLVDILVVDLAGNRGSVDFVSERSVELVVGPSDVVSSWTDVVRLAVRWPDNKAWVSWRHYFANEVVSGPHGVIRS